MARLQISQMAITLLTTGLLLATSVLAQDERREGRDRQEDRGREEGRGRGEGRGWDEGRGRDEGERRQWDPSEFLNRIDRNNDGVLDVEEMSGRNSRFIERLGFDVSRPIRVDSVVRKIAGDRKAAEDNERREALENDPNFRGFTDAGIDKSMAAGFELEEDEKSLAPGFDPPSSSSGVGAGSLQQLDENTQRTVTAILERYDTNKDGVLSDMTDDEKRRVGRWVGSVEEADSDRDGRLSSAELGEAIKRQNLRRGNQERSERFARGGEDRERRGENTRPQVTAQPASPGSPPAAAPAPKALDQRVLSYVDGVFQKYDSNRNGTLEKSELENVKVKFGDLDGDGAISRDEAISHVAGAQKPGESASPAMASANRRRDPGNNRNPGPEDEEDSVRRDLIPAGRTQVIPSEREGAPGSQGETSPSRDFAKLDKNEDGQLQMHEFADGETWSEELSEKFREQDLNQNGLIEPEEFDDRNQI